MKCRCGFDAQGGIRHLENHIRFFRTVQPGRHGAVTA